MRIGQLARTYDIPVQDLIIYLEKIGVDTPHPNGKLFESLERQVLDHFGKKHDMEMEVSEMSIERKINKPIPDQKEADQTWSASAEIASIEGEIEETQEKTPQPEVRIEAEPTVSNRAPNPDEIIETDQLLAMIEAGEMSADLDKIKLIKATKKELAGLKVLGKVELPEPKKKPAKEEKVNNRYPERPQISEAEKEKRRLADKKRQQEQEARLEKRRKEKEVAEQKARKQAHYLQQVQKPTNVEKVKTQEQQKSIEPIEIPHPERPIPNKTILGKFWKWLNT